VLSAHDHRLSYARVRNATLALTVPAPPAAGHVAYLFCDASRAPVFFAFQDGNGPWQAVAGSPPGATSFIFAQAQGSAVC
jgi:hypothetical protein